MLKRKTRMFISLWWMGSMPDTMGSSNCWKAVVDVVPLPIPGGGSFKMDAMGGPKQGSSSERYHLYVESMPVDDIPVLTPDQVARIKMLAANTKAMRDRNEDMSELFSEADMDYANIMNKLVFDDSLQQRPTPAQEFTVVIDQPILPVGKEKKPNEVP
ncbi:unnamed protein product, partial [Sphagnum jensenii]